ncbi:unnamed protein product [Cladocopium goreaui]|uniref:Uncharacterized protein n=1 Tax=Cladocopium goreaui TaxID=2562237 RepID=A0A9P1CI87_9DINO|nr:unnamed protein product [Cladocopium goreaui]
MISRECRVNKTAGRGGTPWIGVSWQWAGGSRCIHNVFGITWRRDKSQVDNDFPFLHAPQHRRTWGVTSAPRGYIAAFVALLAALAAGYSAEGSCRCQQVSSHHRTLLPHDGQWSMRFSHPVGETAIDSWGCFA